jgi:hypothetical protein
MLIGFAYYAFSSYSLKTLDLIVGSDSPLPSGRRKQVQRESKLQRFANIWAL